MLSQRLTLTLGFAENQNLNLKLLCANLLHSNSADIKFVTSI